MSRVVGISSRLKDLFKLNNWFKRGEKGKYIGIRFHIVRYREVYFHRVS